MDYGQENCFPVTTSDDLSREKRGKHCKKAFPSQRYSQDSCFSNDSYSIRRIIVAPSIGCGIFREIVFSGCCLPSRVVREKHAFLLRPPRRILTLAMCENTFERAHPGVNTNAIYQMIYLRKRGGNFVKYFDAIAFASVYTYIASFQTKIFVCSIRKLMEYFEFLSIPRFVTMIQGKYLIYLVSEQIFFLNYFSH